MTTHQTTGFTIEPYPGLPLTVRDAGAGRPVLVLHGGGGPASVTDIVDHFAATSRVLAPTHPGWEDTPRPEWFSDVGDLVETYLDLLDDRDLRDVLVVGVSFGGWIAAEMTVRDRARRVGGLVIMGAFGPHVEGHELRFPTAPPGPPPGQGSGAPAPRRGPSPAALQALTAYAGPTRSDPKLLHRLARVSVPALAVWGEQDTVVPPDFGRAYAAAIPGARFELVPGAGHIPTREAPEVTFAAIDAFSATIGR
ncbi:alpha/beta fold hydrolase [Streptomyces antimycoticus]|uniref:Alpha/beta hydrolase n=2 Tax=Streptomyces violaceusniger group TaxID=2839105 RepID=A0ABD5JL58_9ACTN|nr:MULTISPECIES: alpha/beta hydrolase [Streptomyces]KUL67176.1 hydrolase [Streptomyces violaceusniger]MEE4588805.1 alpha/beta hydrolase [Streptomyces sp. DSM 41602]QTI89617.1 alpha/beta hydrolase [Streptomyces sp. AgN23]RSS42044.1 alpha/beta hydrolase [Streptomyces sp. WAC05858]